MDRHTVRVVEPDGLVVGDRLAECDALVHVRHHVVEHRARGSDGQGAPGEPCARDALHVHVRRRVAEQGGRGHAHVLEHEAARAGGAQAHRGLGHGEHALGAGLEDEERGTAPFELRRYHEQLGVGGARHERLGAAQDEVAVGAAGARVEALGVEQRPRLEQG